MIWKKRKEVVLDCFTCDENTYKNHPIQPLRNAFPQWWKDLPNYNNTNEVNMKHCPGIVNLYKTGVCVPLWCDINIDIDNNSVGVKTNGSTSFEDHPNFQYKNFLKNNCHYQHIKINSPWAVKTKKEKYFFISSALWNGVGIDNLKEINIVPGVIEFYYNYSINVNMFINKEKNKQISLKKNQIMSYYTPLFEEKLIIKNHLISEKEYIEIFFNSKIELFRKKRYHRAKKLK